jgi:hypothetical protein
MTATSAEPTIFCHVPKKLIFFGFIWLHLASLGWLATGAEREWSDGVGVLL